MEITNIDIYKIKTNSKMVGVANILLDDCLVIHDIRIIEGNKGLFLAMPCKKTKKGYKDIVHPINQSLRKYFEKNIIDAFNNIES